MDSDTRSPIETLEARVAPAVITVAFTDGALTLTGDNSDNDFTIEALDATTFQLTGGVGTQFKLGSDPLTSTLRLTGAIKSLDATLGTANDNFNILGLNVGGDVTIDAGDGINDINILSLNAKGSLAITSGNGNDDVALGGTGSVIVKKNLTVDVGDGTNTFGTARFTQIGGDLTFTGGSGDDDIALGGPRIIVGKTASFTFGVGEATLQVTATRMSLGKDFVYDASNSVGADGSTLNFASGGIIAKGSLILRDGDAATTIESGIFGSQFGKVDIVTGGGSYLVQASGLSAKSIVIDASASSSGTFQVNSLTGGMSAKTLKFTGGAGADTFAINLITAQPISITADLGDGANQSNLQLFNTELKSLSITGGSGTDLISAVLLNTNISGNVTFDLGEGMSTTTAQILDGKVSGMLNVSYGSGASSTLSLTAINTQLGGVSFTTAASSNNFSLSTTGDSAVKGAISFTGGDGTDSVNLAGIGGGNVGKGIKLELGNGDNQVTVSYSDNAIKSLAITGGSNADTVNVSGNADLGAVNLDLGAGNNFATFAGQPGSFLVAKALTFTSTSAGAETDLISIARLQVLGKFDAKLGAGGSSLAINDSSIGSVFSVDTGDGSDVVDIDILDQGTGVVFTKAATILLGEGNDTLTIGGNGTSQLLTTKSTFKADGGAGMNTLTDSPTNNYKKDPIFTGFA